MRPVSLADGLSARKFHSFLFPDAPALGPNVYAAQIIWKDGERSHEITHGCKPSDTLSLLTDIVTSCPYPEIIAVLVHFEPPPGLSLPSTGYKACAHSTFLGGPQGYPH